MTYAHKHPWLTALAAIVFFFLCVAVIGSDEDPEQNRPTIESVADLGHEMRHVPPTRDPLYGKPYKELCRDVGHDREICR